LAQAYTKSAAIQPLRDDENCCGELKHTRVFCRRARPHDLVHGAPPFTQPFGRDDGAGLAFRPEIR